jgi:hypothetical protein
MEADASYFHTIAEVAVTLAGFSGIVVALLGRGAAWRENDRYGLMVVLLCCVYALVLSLLPTALAFFDVAAAR